MNRRFYRWVVRQLWIPDDLLARWDRLLCTRAKVHGYSCRGRHDHWTPGHGLVDPDRWM